MTVDKEAIIQARIRGYSARAIAKHLDCTLAEVNAALDDFAKLTLTKNLRTHTLALELERLDEIQRVFEKMARNGDMAAAILITKLIERRSILLGLAAPPRVDPQLIELQIKPAETSTERIRAAINRIRARSLQKLEPKQEDEAN